MTLSPLHTLRMLVSLVTTAFLFLYRQKFCFPESPDCYLLWEVLERPTSLVRSRASPESLQIAFILLD